MCRRPTPRTLDPGSRTAGWLVEMTATDDEMATLDAATDEALVTDDTIIAILLGRRGETV